MNYEIYKGEIGIFQDAIGRYVGGEILDINEAHAYIEGQDCSADVQLDEVFLAIPLTQAARDEADLAKNPIVQSRAQSMNARYAHVAAREAEVLKREQAVSDKEAELAELRKQVEVYKGQRDMCFRRLRRMDDELNER